MAKGLCVKCMRIRQLQKHHVLPVSKYGRKDNHSTILLCDDCHKEIERILPYRKLDTDEYLHITKMWLLNIDVTVC